MEQVTIRSWGNSQGIRIPKSIINRMDLKVSDTLDIEIVDNSIVMSKTFRHKSFEERLNEHNGEINIYEFNWGEPVGKEML